MAFCTNCGSKLDDGVAFCPSCGTKVEAPVAEPKAEEIKTFVESSVNERILNNRVKADVVKGFVETKEKSFDVIKDIAKRDLSDKTPEEIGKRVQLHIDKV